MKIVFLIGNQPNHIALAHKISKIIKPELIVTESRSVRSRITLKSLYKKVISLFSFPIHRTWSRLQKHYQNNYQLPSNIPLLKVGNINSSDVLTVIREIKPDYIFVSGTRLIKKEIINNFEQYSKIINLHTGLSPYIKGGPNCTNWCLAINKPQFIGNSIMWLNAGIDSGNLITTKTLDLNKITSFYDLHFQVMEEAHELYENVVQAILRGDELPNIPQMAINKGRTYYTKDWNLGKQLKCLFNFLVLFKIKKTIPKSKERIKQISLLS